MSKLFVTQVLFQYLHHLHLNVEEGLKGVNILIQFNNFYREDYFHFKAEVTE